METELDFHKAANEKLEAKISKLEEELSRVKKEMNQEINQGQKQQDTS
jgi:hypothetical protein